MVAPRLDDEQYRDLLRFRTALRRFLHWSDQQAAAEGVTAQQHQLMLAIRGHAGGGPPPTVGDVAASLLLKHHSLVELVDRAEHAGLVERAHDVDDRRVVRLQLTATGRRVLDRLSAAHLQELTRLAPAIERVARGLEGDGRPS